MPKQFRKHIATLFRCVKRFTNRKRIEFCQAALRAKFIDANLAADIGIDSHGFLQQESSKWSQIRRGISLVQPLSQHACIHENTDAAKPFVHKARCEVYAAV